jgi:hypothetical protein
MFDVHTLDLNWFKLSKLAKFQDLKYLFFRKPTSVIVYLVH